MGLICSSYNQTITTSNTLVCGYLIKISDMEPSLESIEILLDEIQWVGIGSGCNATQYNNVILSFHLVSKNINNNTAVIDLVESDNPCNSISCPDKCYGTDLYYERCTKTYDSDCIPTGYICEKDTLKKEDSPLCKIATHVLDLTISPYSWYSPQGAADYLITNLVSINGMIVNWLTPFTGWTFIYTEIIIVGTNVIIRVHLNDGSTAPAPSILSASNMNMQTLAVQLGIVEIGLIMAILGTICITVGIPAAIVLTTILTGTKDPAKQFTPEDVVKIVITDPDSIVARQLEECDINFAADAAGLKLCYDSVMKGAQDGLEDKLNLPPPTINIPTETQKCLDQYLIDSNWTNYQTCLLAVKLAAGGELLDAVICPPGEYYDITQGKCVTTEDCWIPGLTPGSCILTAKTGKTIVIIGGVVAGGYLLFSLIKK